MATGEQQIFEFDAAGLPDNDSIYFSTSIINNKLSVEWNKIKPAEKAVITNKEIFINKTTEPVVTEKEMGKIAFPPIAGSNSKILILGTMPGERSLFLQQYYGHAGNHFWKIMYSLFDKTFNKDYEDRKKLLLENGIALWDVLQYSEGLGSADSAIINEKTNDFASFYNKHLQIQKVFFSSKKAEEFYNKHVGKEDSKTYYVLPSPSSANTWKTFDEKLAEWKIILKHL